MLTIVLPYIHSAPGKACCGWAQLHGAVRHLRNERHRFSGSGRDLVARIRRRPPLDGQTGALTILTWSSPISRESTILTSRTRCGARKESPLLGRSGGPSSRRTIWMLGLDARRPCGRRRTSTFGPRCGSHSDADHCYNTPRAWYHAALPESHVPFVWDGPARGLSPPNPTICRGAWCPSARSPWKT